MRAHVPALAFALTALLTAGGGAQTRGQDTAELAVRRRLEFRPVLGGLLATGAQKRAFEDGALVGIQLAAEVHRIVHVVGAFAYVPTQTRRADGGLDQIRILQWDLGVELNARLRRRGHWTPKPFIGAGVGHRTFGNVRRDMRRGYPTVYGGLGIEYQTDVVGVRLEARDYVSRFAGFDAAEPDAVRNDIGLAIGIAYHIR